MSRSRRDLALTDLTTLAPLWSKPASSVARDLKPATTKEQTGCLAQLLELPWSRVPAGWGAYLDTLADLPLEVLDSAIKAHIADHDRGRWFPLPADIRAKATDEMSRRRESAKPDLPAIAWEVPEAERVNPAYAIAKLAEIKRSLANKDNPLLGEAVEPAPDDGKWQERVRRGLRGFRLPSEE